MKKLMTTLALAVTSLSAGQAFGLSSLNAMSDNNYSQTERLTIHLYGQEKFGQSSIGIKAKLKQQLGIDTSRLEVSHIQVAAKSLRGGSVQLRVGRNYSHAARVGISSTRQRYMNNRPRSYYSIQLRSPISRTAGQAVKLMTSGRMKIDTITVFVKHQRQQKRRLVIDFYGDHFRGNTVLNLTDEVAFQYGINLKARDLKRVKLVAKSKRGRGQAKLIVNGRIAGSNRIDGYPGNFQSNASYTFYQTMLLNGHVGNSRRRSDVYLQLNGNIKVLKVIIVIESRNDNGRTGPGRRTGDGDIYDDDIYDDGSVITRPGSSRESSAGRSTGTSGRRGGGRA